MRTSDMLQEHRPRVLFGLRPKPRMETSIVVHTHSNVGISARTASHIGRLTRAAIIAIAIGSGLFFCACEAVSTTSGPDAGSSGGHWVQAGFGGCSVTCGGGTQTQAVTCEDAGGNVVADANCPGAPPPTSQTCSTQPCMTTPPTMKLGFGCTGTDISGTSPLPTFNNRDLCLNRCLSLSARCCSYNVTEGGACKASLGSTFPRTDVTIYGVNLPPGSGASCNPGYMLVNGGCVPQ